MYNIEYQKRERRREKEEEAEVPGRGARRSAFIVDISSRLAAPNRTLHHTKPYQKHNI